MGDARTYEMRVDYSDGTFDVVSVSGLSSIGEAIAWAKAEDPDIEQATVLCTIDREPQVKR
jgi:hypothetical protein